jgi:low affinity Fe/Cu permease
LVFFYASEEDIMKLHLHIPMHDRQGTPFVADATGFVIAFLGIFAFFPSMAFSGFGLQTWTILAIIVVSAVHFVTFFFGVIYRNVVKPDIRKEREKVNE